MSKECCMCGTKIGFFDQSLKFQDKNYICSKEISKYGFSKKGSDVPTYKAIDWASNHTINDLKSLIENGKDFQSVLTQKNAEIAPTNFKSTSNTPVIEKAAEKINALKIPKEIKKQLINAQVFDFWFNNKELKSLSDILDYKNGEVIKYAASGIKEESGESRTVLILCTNRRVIFLNKNMFFGGSSTDIPLNMINSVQLLTHLLLAEISITTGADTTVLKQLTKESAKIMAKTIKKQSMEFQQKLLRPQNNSDNITDSADEIRKFKKLADDGIITNEEFEAKKKQLLGL